MGYDHTILTKSTTIHKLPDHRLVKELPISMIRFFHLNLKCHVRVDLKVTIYNFLERPYIHVSFKRWIWSNCGHLMKLIFPENQEVSNQFQAVNQTRSVICPGQRSNFLFLIRTTELIQVSENISDFAFLEHNFNHDVFYSFFSRKNSAYLRSLGKHF